MIALAILELLVIGLAAWQLVKVQRSIRRDREGADNTERTKPWTK
ncbi:hypothetical protein [Methylobacterium iners]|uniref:Uncharacterized protein n=1 Tax=Methylobacterium iners TaxID=418707 RepID=A0ABQ4RYE7_9HYPH|nr:hypothetical protein [Methylobacterium iners]GJD94602.1 hypothetical protein OCOJLMKI_1805 [Methylobacterium iners]